jgi:hypothetical protein
LKHIIPLILTLSLLGCQTPPADITPPAPTAENTPVPTAAPTAVSTEVPFVATIDPDIKNVIGEQEFEELSDMLGPKGEIIAIDYADYAAEQKFEGTIIPDSMVVRDTADWHYEKIVIAEAQGKDGKTGVVWNPDNNQWVVLTAVNTDLLNKDNYTYFNNIDLMVKTGDLDLVLLAQGDFAEPFPENTERPQFWIVVNRNGIIDHSGKMIVDYYLYLDASKKDVFMDEYYVEGNENYQNIMRGLFTKGNEPHKPIVSIKGKTEDGRDIIVIVNKTQNADEKNFFLKLGFDPRLYEFLTGSGPFGNFAIDKQGISDFENALNANRVRMVPVFPTNNPEDWDNLRNNDFGDAMTHGILVNSGIDFRDNVMVRMQKPGDLFARLPDYIQKQVAQNIDFIKSDNPTSDNYRAIPFIDGVVSKELVFILSRHIYETGFSYGSKGP